MARRLPPPQLNAICSGRDTQRHAITSGMTPMLPHQWQTPDRRALKTVVGSAYNAIQQVHRRVADKSFRHAATGPFFIYLYRRANLFWRRLYSSPSPAGPASSPLPDRE